MIAVWMLYCVGISTLFALSALALEHGLRLRGVPIRWVWFGALVGSLLLGAAPWFWRSPAPSDPALSPAGKARSGLIVEAASTSARVPETERAASWLPKGRTFPSQGRLDLPLLLCWSLLSGGGTIFLVGAYRRLGRRRRMWRWSRVDGVRALISRDVGPAVVGFLDGAIVLPEWVLDLHPMQRRLVLTHEEEHLRAGDPRLLGIALASVALMPWNIPLWWQARRLRHAIELDCDARVIARCPDVRTYSALLVEIGERMSGQTIAFAAFSGSSSLLERRIRSMLSRKPRAWRLLTGVSIALAVATMVVACGLPRPRISAPQHPAHSWRTVGDFEYAGSIHDSHAEAEPRRARRPDLDDRGGGFTYAGLEGGG